MQISTIKNPNFEKLFRNPSNGTQVNMLEKFFFGYLSKKIWFRVCSVTAKMFELRNSGENRRKRSESFFENLPREYKDLILVKKNSKLSHACVPLKGGCNHEGRCNNDLADRASAHPQRTLSTITRRPSAHR
jgi:hypothetical protein